MSRLAALTLAEVAYRLNVSRPIIARRIEIGEIQAIKVGTYNRIRYDEYVRHRDSLMAAMVQRISDDLDDELAVS